MSEFFWCPHCLRTFPKDDSITMLASGAAIIGEGINWSGNLEQGIPKIKRVKYCKACQGALDFHALLRGKLDYRGHGPAAGFLTFLVCVPILWVGVNFPFWKSLALALIAACVFAWLFDRLEKRRVSRWGLSPDEARRLSNQ